MKVMVCYVVSDDTRLWHHSVLSSLVLLETGSTVTFQVLCRFSLHWRQIRLILFICTGYGNAVNCRESSAVCLVMKSEDSTCLLCVVAAVIMYLLGGKPSLCVAHTRFFLLRITSRWSCCTLTFPAVTSFDIAICSLQQFALCSDFHAWKVLK